MNSHNDQPLAFPPPPKTVDVWCPHVGHEIEVLAFGHSKVDDTSIQRVTWNPVEARWEVNPENARWQRQSAAKHGWVLSTIWPEHVMEAKRENARAARHAEDEARDQRIETLEATVGVLWHALYGDQSVDEVAAEQAMSKIAL
mgnify:CR=1 FL=1